MASTIFDRESAMLGRYLLVLCIALLGTGCASKQVVVEGNFPKFPAKNQKKLMKEFCTKSKKPYF